MRQNKKDNSAELKAKAIAWDKNIENLQNSKKAYGQSIQEQIISPSVKTYKDKEEKYYEKFDNSEKSLWGKISWEFGRVKDVIKYGVTKEEELKEECENLKQLKINAERFDVKVSAQMYDSKISKLQVVKELLPILQYPAISKEVKEFLQKVIKLPEFDETILVESEALEKEGVTLRHKSLFDQTAAYEMLQKIEQYLQNQLKYLKKDKSRSKQEIERLQDILIKSNIGSEAIEYVKKNTIKAIKKIDNPQLNTNETNWLVAKSQELQASAKPKKLSTEELVKTQIGILESTSISDKHKEFLLKPINQDLFKYIAQLPEAPQLTDNHIVQRANVFLDNESKALKARYKVEDPLKNLKPLSTMFKAVFQPGKVKNKKEELQKQRECEKEAQETYIKKFKESSISSRLSDKGKEKIYEYLNGLKQQLDNKGASKKQTGDDIVKQYKLLKGLFSQKLKEQHEDKVSNFLNIPLTVITPPPEEKNLVTKPVITPRTNKNLNDLSSIGGITLSTKPVPPPRKKASCSALKGSSDNLDEEQQKLLIDFLNLQKTEVTTSDVSKQIEEKNSSSNTKNSISTQTEPADESNELLSNIHKLVDTLNDSPSADNIMPILKAIYEYYLNIEKLSGSMHNMQATVNQLLSQATEIVEKNIGRYSNEETKEILAKIDEIQKVTDRVRDANKLSPLIEPGIIATTYIGTGYNDNTLPPITEEDENSSSTTGSLIFDNNSLGLGIIQSMRDDLDKLVKILNIVKSHDYKQHQKSGLLSNHSPLKFAAIYEGQTFKKVNEPYISKTTKDNEHIGIDAGISIKVNDNGSYDFVVECRENLDGALTHRVLQHINAILRDKILSSCKIEDGVIKVSHTVVQNLIEITKMNKSLDDIYKSLEDLNELLGSNIESSNQSNCESSSTSSSTSSCGSPPSRPTPPPQENKVYYYQEVIERVCFLSTHSSRSGTPDSLPERERNIESVVTQWTSIMNQSTSQISKPDNLAYKFMSKVLAKSCDSLTQDSGIVDDVNTLGATGN